VLIGLVLFAKDIWLYHLQINHWLRKSAPLPNLFSKHQIQINDKEQHIPICLVEGDGPGMATGIFKPTIWLANHHYNSEQSKAIITHELNHIRQHDPLWMWLITLAQRLLWWNPVAFYLAEQAREQIELSCDEKCATELKNEYAYQLANIVLTSNKKQQGFKHILGIKQSNNFNIKRLERLSRMYKMKIKYLVIMLITLTLSVFSVFAINNGSEHNIEKHQTSRIQERTTRSIYRKDADYNKLIDEVLAIAQQAKSNDKIVIETIYQELYQWNNTREVLVPISERVFRKNLFKLCSYLLVKLERYDEIINLYYEIDLKQARQSFTISSRLVEAYIRTGDPEEAVALVENIAYQGSEVQRSLYLRLLIHAYWAANNYEKVLETADEIIAFREEVLKDASSIPFHFKYHAYNRLNNFSQANEVKEQILQIFNYRNVSIPKFRSASPSSFVGQLPEVY